MSVSEYLVGDWVSGGGDTVYVQIHILLTVYEVSMSVCMRCIMYVCVHVCICISVCGICMYLVCVHECM